MELNDKHQLVIQLSEAQARAIQPLLDKSYPAIRQGEYDDELLLLDHTYGVFTEHFVDSEGGIQSYLQHGVDEWDELPDGWLDVSRAELHEWMGIAV